jgi:hypothetical protein
MGKEHKVGERFEDYRIIYEVREKISCEGCSFLDEDGDCSAGYHIEACDESSRNDGKRVIFAEVGEVNN